MPDPILLPRPRELRFPGGGEAQLGSDAAGPKVERDATLPDQGYELRAGPQGVSIRHADDAGLRYARGALAQLERHSGALPALEIRDWPDFPVRGYMLDISRDRVPTRDTLERTVDILAALTTAHVPRYRRPRYRRRPTDRRDGDLLQRPN